MYDHIEPDMVLESILWLFQELKQIKRGDRISVDCKLRTARFGRNYGEQYELKYDEIYNIINYMLTNSFVLIGVQYIAKQIKGLPQGAPPSPPLARLVCIKKEWEYNLLLNEKRLLWGMRFMDDLLILFFYDAKNRDSKKQAEQLKTDFQKNCYFKKWSLKLVDNNIFLSSEIHFEKGTINFRWSNKNRETIKTEKKQKIIRFLHSKSNTANIIKNNSIYSQFLRISRISDKNNVLQDFRDLAAEYEFLGYRKALIIFQMEKVIEKMNNK
jgi:hypothetical protein